MPITIPEDVIDKAAQAAYDVHDGSNTVWADLDPNDRMTYREVAEAAIRSYLAAEPARAEPGVVRVVRTVTIEVKDYDWSAQYDVPIDQAQDDAERYFDTDSLADQFFDALPVLADMGAILTVSPVTR